MLSRTAPLPGGVLLLSLLLPGTALAGEDAAFEAGAVLVPMDQTWQDEGILDAYGMVYALLQEAVPVHWVIDADKGWGDPDVSDLSTYGLDESSGDAVARDFAGGPFVVAAGDADAALAIISAWRSGGGVAEAYVLEEGATLEVARTLFVAPSIAIYEDGKEDIAWAYLNAAGIPDFDGLEWDEDSAYNLDDDEIIGADPVTAGDGALFEEDGYPAYCHLNAMHWDEEDTSAIVMEVRAFSEDLLSSSLFECEAAATIENDADHGGMLGSGIDKVGIDRGDAEVTVGDPGLELFQIDGAWKVVGGSLPDFEGDFHDGVSFITADDGDDEAIIVATGRVDDDPDHGRVSLLAGHEYDTDVPYSDNDELNGVRVFLNSYFTADCANLALAPDISLDGDALTDDLAADLAIDWDNVGVGRARHSTLVLTLPAELTYVGDDADGTYDTDAHTVTWDLGTIPSGELGETITSLSSETAGTFPVSAHLDYYVEATGFEAAWSGEITLFVDTDDDGISDEDEEAGGTDPTDPDSDDDGLSDGDEADHGTDPLDEDTDDDGVSDGDEVESGADPLDGSDGGIPGGGADTGAGTDGGTDTGGADTGAGTDGGTDTGGTDTGGTSADTGGTGADTGGTGDDGAGDSGEPLADDDAVDDDAVDGDAVDGDGGPKLSSCSCASATPGPLHLGGLALLALVLPLRRRRG